MHQWDVKEREMIPFAIIGHTRTLLRIVVLLKFYEKDNFLKGYTNLLKKLIHQCDHNRKAFKVDPNIWYRPTKEDVYFITGLSSRGGGFPHFLDLPPSFIVETKLLMYVQLFINDYITRPSEI